MIKLASKILAAVLLVALAIIAFIKLLPWCIAALAILALVKFGHAWLIRHGLNHPAFWPSWKQDDAPQNAA